jgi:hypothetical protein
VLLQRYGAGRPARACTSGCGYLQELEVTLHVSTDKAATFQPAKFPYKLTEHS